MDHVYEYLGGGAGIGGIIFAFWLKGYLSSIKEDKKKLKTELKKATEDNIQQEVRIKRNEQDIQTIKNKLG